MQLAAGSSAQLQAQVNDERDQPIGGAAIIFRSRDPAIISVNPDGLVSALGTVGVSAVQVASGVRVVEVPVRIVAGAGALLEASKAPPGTAQAGAPIGDVTVRVLDQFNNPVSGAALAWKLDARSGTIESSSAITATDGTGSARWIAGTTAGPQTLEVRSGDLPPLVLNTKVNTGPPATIQLNIEPLPDPAASATVGDRLQLRAQVTDQHGNNVGGVEVRLDGSGACKADAVVQLTDEAGATPASGWKMSGKGSCVIIATTTSPPTLEARMTVPVKSASKRSR